MSAPPRRPTPFVVAVGLIIGLAAVSTSSVLVRLADAPALALGFWRCALGAVALLPFAARHRGVTTLALRVQGLGAGVFLALHFAAFISSLSYTTVASASLLVTMAPLFVGLGAAVFLHEPPSRLTWIGIAVAMVGAAVIALADVDSDAGSNALFGDALAFAGAAMVAGYLLLGRSARQTLPAAVWAGGVYAVAAAVLLVWCLIAGVPLTGFPARTWLVIAAIVIGPQLLGHTMFNALLGVVSASVVAAVVLAEPVGATMLAAWLLNELPRPLFWVGAPVVIAGVWLAIRGARSDDVSASAAAAETGVPSGPSS